MTQQTEPTIIHSGQRIGDISWSQDGSYLRYREYALDTLAWEYGDVVAYHLESGQATQIAEAAAFGVSQFLWMSDTEVLYTYTRYGTEPDNYNSDLYYFDVVTQERRQITHTPDLSEAFECGLG